MDKVTIEKLNETHVRIHADPSVKMEMSDRFEFYVPGYKFIPSYRNKMWDGKIRMLNTMTGMIYSGLVPHIVKFCEDREYLCDIDDDLIPKTEIPDDFGFQLAKEFDAPFVPRDYQNDAVVTALSRQRGLLLSPTASGKSFIIYLVSRYLNQYANKKVLIIVPTTSLVSQMSKDFIIYNKERPLSIHTIMAGADKDVDADYTISTWQSIYKLKKDWFEKFDVVIGDECHLFKAKSTMAIMEKLPYAKYRYGFTGTLDGTQTHKLTLEGLFGATYKVTATKELIADETLSDFNIKSLVLKHCDEDKKIVAKMDYQSEIDFIVRNGARNKFIRNLAWSLNGNTLVLFQFVEKHGKILDVLLRDQNEDKNIFFIHGGVKTEDRENVRELVEKSNNNIILASYGTFSTGINITNLDNLIFASPSKSKIRNLQSIGRVLRRGNGSDNAVLYDIADDLNWKSKMCFASKHFVERMKQYNEEGFDVKIYNVDL